MVASPEECVVDHILGRRKPLNAEIMSSCVSDPDDNLLIVRIIENLLF